MQSEKMEEQAKLNVKERDNMYVVEIELPEYNREEVRVLFNDGYLVVTARKEETDEEFELSKCDAGEMQDRTTEEFKKAYYIGRNVLQDNICAAFNNGVLKCMLTKSEKEYVDGPVEVKIM